MIVLEHVISFQIVYFGCGMLTLRGVIHGPLKAEIIQRKGNVLIQIVSLLDPFG